MTKPEKAPRRVSLIADGDPAKLTQIAEEIDNETRQAYTRTDDDKFILAERGHPLRKEVKNWLDGKRKIRKPGYFPGADNYKWKSGLYVDESDVHSKPLDTRKENSYLVMIAALLKHSGIDPEERGISSAIAAILEQNCTPMDDKTIRGILREIPRAITAREK